MKIYLTAAFAFLTLASADVSHLSRTYLPPVHQSYSAPSYTGASIQSFPSSGVSYSAPSNEYLPPIQHSLSTPTQSFSGLVQQSYSRPANQHTFSAPSSEYLPPVKQTFSAPAPISYSGPSTSYAGPSVNYLPPSLNYAPPSFSYSGPAVQSHPSHSTSYSSSGGDVGTQYAANGGYIYKKK